MLKFKFFSLADITLNLTKELLVVQTLHKFGRESIGG